MSNASEAFSAKDKIESGDWDDYLFALWLAIRERRETIEREGGRHG